MARLAPGPSGRPGACDPCADGNHAACEVDPCTCYDDSWEDHDRLYTLATDLGRARPLTVEQAQEILGGP